MDILEEIFEPSDGLNGGFSLKRLAKKAASAFTGAPRAVAAATQGDLKDFNLFENQSLKDTFQEAFTGNLIVAGAVGGGELASRGSELLNQYAADGFSIDGWFGNDRNNTQPQPQNQYPQDSYDTSYSPTQTAGIGKGAIILGALVAGGFVISSLKKPQNSINAMGAPVAH